MMKLRLATPAALVDLGRIAGLDGSRGNGDGSTIGALATHAAVAGVRGRDRHLPGRSPRPPALIGDRQVRNRGTIGGSLAHADPGADYPTVAEGARRHDRRRRDRTASARSPPTTSSAASSTTALEPGELVTSVRVPATPAGTGAAYVKHRHPASGYAVVGVGRSRRASRAAPARRARLVDRRRDRRRRCTRPLPRRRSSAAPASEEAIAGRREGGRVARRARIGDTYASGEYRVHLAGVLAARALSQAFERAAVGGLY